MGIDCIELVAVLLALLGSFYVARKDRIGFLLWVASNEIWIMFDLYYSHYGQLIMYALFTLTSLYGFWNWRPNNKNG